MTIALGAVAAATCAASLSVAVGSQSETVAGGTEHLARLG